MKSHINRNHIENIYIVEGKDDGIHPIEDLDLVYNGQRRKVRCVLINVWFTDTDKLEDFNMYETYAIMNEKDRKFLGGIIIRNDVYRERFLVYDENGYPVKM